MNKPLNINSTPQVTPQVEEKYKDLLMFCIEPKTRAEMQEYMGLKDKKNFAKNYITPMLEMGILKMTNPDKPNSSIQKYIAAYM